MLKSTESGKIKQKRRKDNRKENILMKKGIRKSIAAFTGAGLLALSVLHVSAAEETEIQVFIAASLNTVMNEIAAKYQEEHP